MSLSNASQLLLRNDDLFSAQYPLFINLPEDGFIDAFLVKTPSANLHCYNTNFIDHQAIQKKHQQRVSCSFTSVFYSEVKHDLVIIAFPKSKNELPFTLAMIAPYLANDAHILFIGENNSGIKSVEKLSVDYLSHCKKIDAARHCTLFSGTFNNYDKQFCLDDWFKVYHFKVANIQLTIASLPGVFSQQKLDVGTALLLNNLPDNLSGSILDFGCGAGVISCFVGKKYKNTTLHLLDVSALALTSAQKTLALNDITATTFASNSLSNVNDKYNHIVSNPPFHQGINTHYQATENFLQKGQQHLYSQGTMIIVANSFLRYRPIMEEYIGKTSTITTKQGFSIYHSKKSN